MFGSNPDSPAAAAAAAAATPNASGRNSNSNSKNNSSNGNGSNGSSSISSSSSGGGGGNGSNSSSSKQPRPSSLPPIPTPPPALDTTAVVEQSRGTSSPTARTKKKARELLASAKNSLSGFNSMSAAFGSGSGPSSDVKGTFRVLRDDSADDSLVSSSNSAGESRPGPRSTFRVGVTEDKNKKCRRTMEDTHSYLYNFLPDVVATASPPPPLPPPSSSSPDQSAASLPSTGTAPAEDAADSDSGYFAIFDGHAGTLAADWCGRQLHLVLEDTIRKHPNTPIPELLDMTFTSCDGQLEKLPVKNSGCTAVCAVLRWEDRPVAGSGSAGAATEAAADADNSNSKGNSTAAAGNENAKPNAAATRTERQRVLYTANVGDARIVLCRNGKALRLSYDHKGSDENEGKRVANAGGLILNNRVNGTINPNGRER